MIISISGTPGSGKSTVGKLLAERLKYKRYYMGQIWRDIAKSKGMTLREGLESGEEDPEPDKEVDEYQKRLGENEDNFVIEGRTSYFIIPDSFKVFLKTDLDVGAERIFKDLKTNSARNEGTFSSVEEVRADLDKRMATDRKRYQEYYDRDVFDESNYDLVIDTSAKTPEEIVDDIVKHIKTKTL